MIVFVLWGDCYSYGDLNTIRELVSALIRQRRYGLHQTLV